MSAAFTGRGASDPALAASFVRDALRGLPSRRLLDARSLRVYRLYHSLPYNVFVVAVLVLNHALALWEHPSQWPAEGNWCHKVEIFTWLVMVGDLALHVLHHPRAECARDSWVLARAGVLLLMLGEWGASTYDPTVIRLGRALRPVFLIEKDRYLRRLFAAVASAVPNILGVLLLAAIHVSIFALAGHLLFNNSSYVETGPLPCSTYVSDRVRVCDNYFSSMPEASLNLFVLMTTANFPDVMLPAYRRSKWAALYFAAYIIIGLYVFANLILVSAYRSYERWTRKLFVKREFLRQVALHRAFHALAGLRVADVDEKALRAPALSFSEAAIAEEEEDDEAPEADDAQERLLPAQDPGQAAITRLQWRDLMRLLRPDLDSEVVDIFFAAIDADDVGAVGVAEFEELCELVHVEAEAGAYDDDDESSQGIEETGWWQVSVVGRLRALVHDPRTDQAIDAVVLVNVGLLLWSLSLRDTNDALSGVLDLILLFFVLEMAVKLLVLGWRPFSRTFFNRLDLTVVGLGCCNLFLPLLPLGDSTALRTVLQMMRLLRFVRLLRPFMLILTTIGQLVAPTVRFLGLVAALFYAFAIVGMESFAGKLNVRASEAVFESAYGVNGYENLNFNDLPSAYTSLWALLIVNNWPVLMEGCVAATSTWARLYFLAFYFLGVMVLINVLVAMLLDLFMEQFALNKKRLRGGKEEWLVLVDRAAARRGRAGRWEFSQRPGIGDVLGNLFRTDVPWQMSARIDLRSVTVDRPSNSAAVQQQAQAAAAAATAREGDEAELERRRQRRRTMAASAGSVGRG